MAQMATTIGNLITLDGQFADWPAADAVMKPANTVAGYQVYGPSQWRSRAATS